MRRVGWSARVVIGHDHRGPLRTLRTANYQPPLVTNDPPLGATEGCRTRSACASSAASGCPRCVAIRYQYRGGASLPFPTTFQTAWNPEALKPRCAFCLPFVHQFDGTRYNSHSTGENGDGFHGDGCRRS